VADIIKEIDTELTIQEVKNDKRQPKAKKATNADSNEADKNRNNVRKEIIIEENTESKNIEEAETDTESYNGREKDKMKPDLDPIDDEDYEFLDKQYNAIYEDMVSHVKFKKSNNQYKEAASWRYVRDNLAKSIGDREDADKIVKYFCRRCGKKARSNIKDSLELIAKTLIA